MSNLEQAKRLIMDAFGFRARITVVISACDCPTPGCTGDLDSFECCGLLGDEVWCTECEWEGTREDLLGDG